jgi:hypothetical protein
MPRASSCSGRTSSRSGSTAGISLPASRWSALWRTTTTSTSTHARKQSKVILATEPIERYLCGKPGISPRDASWRLYRYLKAAAGISYAVECDHPDVECCLLHEGERLMVVLVNHSDATVEAELRGSADVAVLTALDGQAHELINGVTWIALAANQGLVLRA